MHPPSLNFDSLATDVDIATIVNRCGKTKFDELDVHNAGQIEGLAAFQLGISCRIWQLDTCVSVV